LQPGTTLVEASAGTGKTYAISMLVLRAVAELGIDLKQILVVTYTVAATEEIRERVRLRLLDARNLLHGSADGVDDVLQEWQVRIPDREQAQKRIDLALLDIDAVSIHTIHGFCQRILTEQVLESGHLFDMDLVSDTLALRTELVQDFWRNTLYDIDPRYGSLILGKYPALQALVESVSGADQPLTQLLPDTVTFAGACAQFDEARSLLMTWWKEQGAMLRSDLADAVGNGYFNKAVRTGYEQWLYQFEACVQEQTSPPPGLVAELQPERLVSGLNKTKIRSEDARRALVAGMALPLDIGDHYERAAAGLLLGVRLDLAAYIRTELSARLHRRGKLGFDELVVDLARAIDAAAGARLSSAVGARYRAALIDEFQDTDAAQYTIFSRFFGQGNHHLYVIVDPKQAIYRFRGADINSYLKARADADRMLTLDCNYRSTPGLVGAVNNLFAGCRIAGSIYQPVRSPHTSAETMLTENEAEQPGLIYCQLEPQDDDQGAWTKSHANDPVRQWVVREVMRLLDPESSCTIARTDGSGGNYHEPVRPGNIGILVRTNRQAEEFFSAFGGHGIPAVLSSRRPVYETREGRDLLVILQAVADPADQVLLHTALGIDWFGLDGGRFHEIVSDDRQLNAYRERFFDYHRSWQEAGLLAMMNRLLENDEIYLNLSKTPQAERRITNIQHLVELIQQQESERRLSIPQTLHELQRKLAEPAGEKDDELRLESDGDAVNVVTMHSAKGLEYDIVFCPYLFHASRGASSRTVVTCHDPELGRVCDIGSERFDERAAMAAREEEEEDLRLAYVAVTRARLCCYLPWVDTKQTAQSRPSFASPLGRLLFPDGACSFAEQQEQLLNLARQGACGYRTIPAQLDEAVYRYRRLDASVELEAKRYDPRRLLTDRIRTSFSGLTALARAPLEAESKAGDEAAPQPPPTTDPLPGGVRFGNLVHDAFEIFEFSALARNEIDRHELDALISRSRLDIDPERLQELLVRAVTTLLPAPGSGRAPFTLADIAPGKQIKEMEFTLHLDPVNTGDIVSILEHEETVTGLTRKPIEGYLNGFMDLVFEHGDRYYIADYKSNFLGSPQAYNRENLPAAMRSHNYGLQYWIYTVALHRYLRNWFGGGTYRYSEHFGGVMYLFVRGMNPEQPASGVYFTKPDERTLMQLDRCFGEQRRD